MDQTKTKTINTWYLENTLSGKRVPVSEDQTPHKILDSVDEDERKDWVLCYGTCEVSVTENEVQVELPSGIVETYIDDTVIRDRRAHPRLEMYLRVTIISGKRIFRTSTRNVSLGGLQLRASPPRDYSHPELQIIIENLDGSKKIMSEMSFIKDSAQKQLKFVNMKNEDQTVLATWIESLGVESKEAV